MPGGKRGGGSGVDWLPASAYRVAMNATATDAQITILDQVAENLSNSQDYGSGALVGLRAWLGMYAGTAQLAPSEFVILVLPSGMAVPTVVTGANKKANERFIWAMGLFELRGTATTEIQMRYLELGSSRKFDQGDRLIVVFVNRGVATAATGVGSALVDIYVREQ